MAQPDAAPTLLRFSLRHFASLRALHVLSGNAAASPARARVLLAFLGFDRFATMNDAYALLRFSLRHFASLRALHVLSGNAAASPARARVLLAFLGFDLFATMNDAYASSPVPAAVSVLSAMLPCPCSIGFR